MAVAFQDYYEALGVPRDASEEDIRRAYRRLARQIPPGRQQGARRRGPLQGDLGGLRGPARPEKRARYDRLRRELAGRTRTSRGAPGSSEAFGPRGDGFGDVRVEFGGGDFSDFFEGLFGRAGATRAAGRGRLRGVLDARRRPGGGARADARGGGGGGKRRLSLGDGRDFEVEIPRGVRDGQRIRLAGQGGAGRRRRAARRPVPARPAQAAPALPRRGARPLRRSAVSPWEAALGAEVPVPTLDGNARVKVPAGILQRPPAAAARPGAAGRRSGRPATSTRSSRSSVPKTLTKRGARAVRAARVDVEVRSAEGAADGTHGNAPTRTGDPARDARALGWSASTRSPREAGLHPDARAALVRLGLIEPDGGTARGAAVPAPGRALLLARAARLRRDLGLNYAGAVLASELLARIDELERRLRCAAPPTTPSTR